MDGGTVEVYQPVEAEGCADQEDEDADGDDFARAGQEVVAEAGVAVEGGEVLREEDQLAGLDGVPLSRPLRNPQTVSEEDGEEDGAEAVGGVLEVVVQGRLLTDADALTLVEAVQEVEDYQAATSHVCAHGGVLFSVDAEHVPAVGEDAQSREGDKVRGDIVRDEGGDVVEEVVGRLGGEGAVLDDLLPAAKVLLLGGLQEELSPAVGVGKLRGDVLETLIDVREGARDLGRNFR
mmetsp:Transcript_23994/g.45156  ORF Transcript_23994/g.45156 Transcript_23994/m.45156 type:complete len:235 (-) Transcript_23994:34-738(-)